MNFKLTSTQIDILKLIAIVFMVLDHANKAYINEEVFFLFGRIVYPIFSILLVYNYLYNSKDRSGYLKRLYLFAFISQVPFYLLFENAMLNILFSLAFALTFIHYILNTDKNNIEKFGALGLISAILYFLPIQFFEYGLIGFLSTISFYYLFSMKQALFSLPVIFVNGLNPLKIIFTTIPLLIVYFIQKIEINFVFNRKIMSRFFYLFYPGHLFLLYLISFF